MFNLICSVLAKVFPKTEKEVVNEVWEAFLKDKKQPVLYIKYKTSQGSSIELLTPENIEIAGDIYARHMFYIYPVHSLLKKLKKKDRKLIFKKTSDDNYLHKDLCSYIPWITDSSSNDVGLSFNKELHSF